MTQIDFYFNASDKLRLAVNLSSKALSLHLSGTTPSRVFLLAPDDEVCRQVETSLWTLQQTSFLPHCRSSDVRAPETPLIVDHASDHLVHDEILLNLCSHTPTFFSRFHRLIEIVGQAEEDKLQARERFRFYRDRGYDIRRHDVAGKV